jgi:MFS family permease
MNRDTILLLHPLIAVTVVFPLLGMVMNRAIQTRQRRMQLSTGSKKSTIPASTGPEHSQLGRWLTGSVVGIVLLAFANDVFGNIVDKQVWAKSPFQVILISLVFVVTIASLSLLYLAKTRLWRIVFAMLTSVALIVIGSQDGVYRLNPWYISHYHYGIAAALLMIFSLAIVREIYQDRTNRWRNIHIILNSIALLLFIGQVFTGTQALLEVPLAWQKPYVEKLYEQQCDKKPCTVQSAPALKMPK